MTISDPSPIYAFEKWDMGNNNCILVFKFKL